MCKCTKSLGASEAFPDCFVSVDVPIISPLLYATFPLVVVVKSHIASMVCKQVYIVIYYTIVNGEETAMIWSYIICLMIGIAGIAGLALVIAYGERLPREKRWLIPILYVVSGSVYATGIYLACTWIPVLMRATPPPQAINPVDRVWAGVVDVDKTNKGQTVLVVEVSESKQRYAIACLPEQKVCPTAKRGDGVVYDVLPDPSGQGVVRRIAYLVEGPPELADVPTPTPTR